MKCDEARDCLHQERRGRLDADEREPLDAHLADCAECSRLREEENAIDGALKRLPRHAAPVALRARLEPSSALPSMPAARMGPAAKMGSERWRKILSRGAPLVALAALVLLTIRFAGTGVGDDSLVREAVNDHLRVLYSEHPVEIESGGIHQVKPWFAGKVDFAPTLGFAGDDEFVLDGGSVGYVIDRKAAIFHFHHKLHSISLLVFRGEGIAWPSPNGSIGRVHAHVDSARGYHVITWRDADLGYVLVSDVDAAELHRLAERIVDPPPEAK